MTKLLITLLGSILLAAPGLAEAKYEAVTEVEEDRAGYDAAHEVDFRTLSAVATAEGVDLTIDLWTPWGKLDAPEDSQISIQLARSGSRKFTSEVEVSFGGTWEMRPISKASAAKGDEDEEPAKPPATATGEATISGNTISLTIPWEHVAHSTIWLKAQASTSSEESSAVDEIPNGDTVLEVARP